MPASLDFVFLFLFLLTNSSYRIREEFGFVDGAVKHGVHAGPSGLDGHAATDAVASAGPAGVDEEALRTVLVQLLLEQVGIPESSKKEII